MEIKKCLNSEVPNPSNSAGYFYLDQETSKLKLKKSDETISWDLVGTNKYKDVDAETARLCHILENDDTEGYAGKVLIQFDNSCTTIPLLESSSGYRGDENYRYDLKKWDAIKTSDGQFYTDDKTLVHTFADDCTDKYIICYYHNNSSADVYVGFNLEFIPDDEDWPSYLDYAIEKTERAIYFNFDFYDSFGSSFFDHDTGYYSSITFLDCNFEHVNTLEFCAFGGTTFEHLYILNEQTNNSLNFINVQTFYGPFAIRSVPYLYME